jgi:hypothetical protein
MMSDPAQEDQMAASSASQLRPLQQPLPVTGDHYASSLKLLELWPESQELWFVQIDRIFIT